MVKITYKIALCFLMLLGWVGSAMAQDSPYVIKIKGSNNYLAHVFNQTTNKWEVTNATSFSPNCLWYSGIEQNVTGTNHNYYFDDGTNLHFLSAPMTPDGILGLSNSLPPTYLLTNTDTIYYFYDWDTDNKPDGGGVARGHQYYGINNQSDCENCGSSWGDNQCWRVYWVAFKDEAWKLTSKSYYDVNEIDNSIDGIGGRYRKVTVNEVVEHVSGGLDDLSPFEMNYEETHSLSATITPYSYKIYTHYSFVDNTNTTNTTPTLVTSEPYYYGGSDHPDPPTNANGSGGSVTKYEWTLSGPGAQYLSFAQGSAVDTIYGPTPKVYYRIENVTGTKDATLKLKVTYSSGVTQEKTAKITVKTGCQNPTQAAAPKVYYNDVTVSWYNIAQNYVVHSRKKTESEWQKDTIAAATGEIMSHTFTDLAEETTYQYMVQAKCGDNWLSVPTTYIEFTTGKAPELMIYGSVFGGGRMADVTGSPTVVIVNCDSIDAVYGGNDIAGTVGNGTGGSTITLGTAETEKTVRIGSVYGGGNGYYAYGSQTFSPAEPTAPTATVTGHAGVYALSNANAWTDMVWENPKDSDTILTIPSITKTAIVVANDYVKVDTVFGGAKNAFLTANSGNGSAITINGGTMVAVFGGNNIGGSQGSGKHYLKVDEATKDASSNYLTRIHTLYGGGNKVAGSETDILVNGGQIDTLYAGGNSADVAAAKVEVDCAIAAATSSTPTLFGKTYSSAIASYSSGNLAIKDNYNWDGAGVYNVRTLFGGNNQANMAVVPTITLTSGSVGTVYGGGNAGDMNGGIDDPGSIATDFGALVFERDLTNPNDNEVITRKYSTYVELSSDKMLVDYLYGGCQMSNVYYSSWVNMSGGHVGTVYGGCNISGDVGSRYLLPDGDPFLIEEGVQSAYKLGPRHEKYQAVKGGTFVKVSGGHIYKDLFAGSNGRYHCNNGKHYVAGIDFDGVDTEGRYLGMSIPSHNETHVYVSGTAEVNGSVYSGGNLACVGFINESVPDEFYTPVFVGMASVRMNGGHVHGNVFGGGNMASIWGSNSVRVEGGTIDGALYGGNDRIGLVAQITNRVLPSDYGIASDGFTSLDDVRTYISLTGRPDVGTVYGGGNGDYDYSVGEYCNSNDQPVQSNTFVDINIDGFADGLVPGGHIGTVYGGGNGVTVTGSTTVFLNVKGPNASTPPTAYDHVGTIFGGNNKGALAILPDIVLASGQVNTVYGGCNAGAMIGSYNVAGYNNVGSRVILRNSYQAGGSSHPLTGVVSNAVYGGCRMNGVDNNTLVLVEGGAYGDTVNFFGGSDISGNIGGTSQVVVTGGTVGNIYGGGNGNYHYVGNKVYDFNNNLIDTIASGTIAAPQCGTSLVDILDGQVGKDATHRSNVFGGGLGEGTSTTGNVTVNIGNNTTGPSNIYGDVYGGSALGRVNTSAADKTIVNILNGTITGDVYGGGLGDTLTGHQVEAKVYGKTYVNVGSDLSSGNITFNTYEKDSKTYGANVFGCNNLNGSPQDSVFVNIYKTAHTDGSNSTPNNTFPSGITTVAGLNSNASSQEYAIQAVYGGGNVATYAPSVEKRSTQVHVYGCDQNTIKDVYGGGNAANVGVNGSLTANTFVTIDGGRIHRVFNGGNGEISPASIFGTATTTVNHGLIDQIFGGGNMQGAIDSTSLLIAKSSSCSGEEVFGEVFGGANMAEITTSRTLATVIDCGVGKIGGIYGGSNLADINGNVSLTIRGGQFNEVYGGSKGKTGSNPTDAANITGDVTLNLVGGTIAQAFGGSNINGNITGKITVNVLDTVASCGLQLDTVYGSGNLTAYRPTDPGLLSPEVNFLKGNVNHVIFGGGKGTTATVKANPVVNIGDATHTNYVTNVYGNVFGGGNAAPVEGSTKINFNANHDTDTVYNLFGGGNLAGVTGNAEVNVNSGRVTTAVYGGCNEEGTIGGNINVNVLNNLGAGGTDGFNVNVFGGGLGKETQTDGNVTVTLGTDAGGTASPVIYGNVYGGSALGSVNSGNDDVTKVWLKSGTVNGRVFGGGLGRKESTGVTAIAAQVKGGVQVLVDDGEVTTAVYGCNDQNGAPLDTVNVTINNGTIANVVGGGNLANYIAPTSNRDYPVINIKNGTVTKKVVGGGNAANVTSNPTINISGGTLCTSSTNSGIYGGCNETGTVDGDITLNITNGTIGDSLTLVNTEIPFNVHGGGYGQGTSTTGNVTVNFGKLTYDNGTEVHSRYPILFGDLYGGSALGSVNGGASNNTTVNILNGTIKSLSKTVNLSATQDSTYFYSGNIYGGGLGRKAATGIAAVEAVENGVIRVNIGSSETVHGTNGDTTIYHGKASLVDCSVYGCNNANGSPQEQVFVDVYQTKHTLKDSASYNQNDRAYAIKNVFGGGNQAHYAPTSNSGNKKTHTTIHHCSNTIDYVYGGGNAADSYGSVLHVDGGRFNFIFGGGNGQVSPANIGEGSVDMTILSGHVGWYFEGCNMHGSVGGTPITLYGCNSGCPCGADSLIVENYYFGANMATIYGGLNNTIKCSDNMVYRNVYAGSRLATVYGDIRLTVQGGIIDNLYGGSEGSELISADVKQFPADSTTVADTELKAYLGSHPEMLGKGGNIYLTIEGGKLGNVFGGNNYRGNVEGNIFITVDSIAGLDESCRLDLDYVYGGNNLAAYQPLKDTITPVVHIKNGHVNYDVFGGSKGVQPGEPPHNFGNGKVESNPKVIIGDDTANTTKKAKVGRDVFGGGSAGNVVGNTTVILQGNTTIDGNVFGGCKLSDVTGSTEVILAPTSTGAKSNGDK